MTQTWSMRDKCVTYTTDDKLLGELLSIKGVEKFGTYRDKKCGIRAWQVVYNCKLRNGVETQIRAFKKAQKVPLSEEQKCHTCP